jgi:hypothetical protein
MQAPFDFDPDDFEDENFNPEVSFEGAYTPPVGDSSASSTIMDLSDSLNGSESGSDLGSDLGSNSNSNSNSDFDFDLKPITSSTPIYTATTKRPLIQSTLPFQPIPRSEWLIQESRRYHERKEQYEQASERLKLAEAKRKMAHRR